MARRKVAELLEARVLFAGFTGSATTTDVVTGANANTPFAALEVGAGESANELYVYPKGGVVVAQIFDEAGDVVVPEFQVSPAGVQSSSFANASFSWARDATGNAYVTFPTTDSFFANNSFLVEIKPDGSMPFAPVPLIADANSHINQQYPSIAIDSTTGNVYTAFVAIGGATAQQLATYEVFSPAGAVLQAPAVLDTLGDPAPNRVLDKYVALTPLMGGGALAGWVSETLDTNFLVSEQSLTSRTINPDLTLGTQGLLFSEPDFQTTTVDGPRFAITSSGVYVVFDRQVFDASGFNFQHSIFMGASLTPGGLPISGYPATMFFQSGQGSKTVISDMVTLPTATGGLGNMVAVFGPDGLPTNTAPFITGSGTRAIALDVSGAMPVVKNNDVVQIGPATQTGDVKVISATPTTVVGVQTGVSFDVAVAQYTTGGGSGVAWGGINYAVNPSVPLPKISLTPETVIVNETATGASAIYDVTVEAHTNTVSVRFSTIDDHPVDQAGNYLIAGVGYKAENKVLTFPPGQTTQQVVIEIKANGVGHGATFLLAAKLSEPVNAQVTSGDTNISVVGLPVVPAYTANFVPPTLPGKVPPGTTATAMVTIPSVSGSTASGKVTLETDLVSTTDENSRFVASMVTAFLKAGKSTTVKETVKLPADMPPGTYKYEGTLMPVANGGLSSGDVDPRLAVSGAGTVVVANVANGNGKALVVQDSAGTFAAVSLKGPGTAELVPVAGGGQDLVVTGTDATSKLTVKVLGKTSFVVRNVSVTGNIASVDLGQVAPTGNVVVSGNILKLAVGPVKDEHSIALGAASGAGSTPVSITLGDVENATINSTQPITSLTVASWTDSDATEDLITAPSIAQLMSKGGFAASVTAASIGKLTVGGVMGSDTALHTIRLADSLGAASVGGIRAYHVFVGVGAEVDALPTSAADIVNHNASIKSFVVGGKTPVFSNTVIATSQLGSVTVKGVVGDNLSPFGFASLNLSSYSRDKIKASKVTGSRVYDSLMNYSATVLG